MKKVLLYTGSVFTFLFSLLHLSFWKMGNWSVELKNISRDNAGIVQALNIGSIYFLLFTSVIIFIIAKKSNFEKTDKLILMLAGGYYIMRIIMGFPLFGITAEEIIIQVLCLFVACCYMIPIILNNKIKQS